MAKIEIKSDRITPFGGIFSVMEQFDSMLSQTIDTTLGLRCRSYGYRYSEIIRSLMCVYFCGGTCVEDVTSHLTPHLSLHPTLRTCSSDTILGAVEELTEEDVSYTSEAGKSYAFNTAERLNGLLVGALLATGGLKVGGTYDLDFDHQFLETEKYDAKPTYKHFLGYRPAVAVIGDLIVGIENSDGNSILVEKWKGKAHRLVIQRQRRIDGEADLWEGEYTYRCILTNDFGSSATDIVEFYNLRGGKERILDDMGNGFGWRRLPKSSMAGNAAFLVLTALIRNFYKAVMQRIGVGRFGLKATSRIKAFVFRFVSVPAKWVRTARRNVLNIYSCNHAYADPFAAGGG